MAIKLSRRQFDLLVENGFKVRPGEKFQVGTHCPWKPGAEPPRQTETCAATCFGEDGLFSRQGFPILCMHENDPIEIA